MLDITNFWNASVGTFRHIDRIPSGFEEFADNGNSTYFTNKQKTVIVRMSDHWGSGIRECNWYLKGFPRNNSFLFSKKYKGEYFIGIIPISKLIDIQGY